MNFFLLSPFQRILEWRKFRHDLKSFDEFQQLKETCRFWAQVPIQTYALDWDHAELWPSAWQLLYEGNFDSIVVAFLMEQTLLLIGWDPKRLKLIYLKNSKLEDQMMILLIDDRWALNYSYQDVFDFTQIKNDCILMVKYQIENGKRIQL